MAQGYTGIARTQLGILKDNMRLGNLAQLSRTVELTDGTKIFVSSIHGQDTIRVETPAAIAAAGTTTTPAATLGGGSYAYIAGAGVDPTTGLAHVFRAKISVSGGGVLEMLDIGVLSGGLPTYDGLIAMSADGSVIVYADAGAVGPNIPSGPYGTAQAYNLYRWTAATGSAYLGTALGVWWGGRNATAFSMASNGLAITYTGVVGGNWRQMYWSSVAGVQAISPSPQTYTIVTQHYTQAYPAAQGISADGSTAIFYCQIPVTGGANWLPHIWTANTGAVAVGFLGNTNTPAFPGGWATLSADGSTIFANSGTGTLYAPANTIIQWIGGTFTITRVPFGDYFLVSSNGSVLVTAGNTIYRWTSAGTVAIDTSEFSTSLNMTADGSAIAYSTALVAANTVSCKLWTAQSGVTVLRTVSPYGGLFNSPLPDSFISADGSVVAFTSDEPTARAWRQSKGVATELIGAAGYGAAATGVGPDGAIVAGIANTANGLRVSGWASMQAAVTLLGGDPRGAYGFAAAMVVTKVIPG